MYTASTSKLNSPVLELYDRSPPAENNPRTSEESTEMFPSTKSIPWPPAKWFLTSDALGPVYVNWPVAES